LKVSEIGFNLQKNRWIKFENGDGSIIEDEECLLEPIPLTEEWLVRAGGKRLPFPSILNPLIFDIGRNRILSCGCVGTPNEMIWICEVNATDSQKIDDLVCVHNYDYDGYMPVHRFQNIHHSLTGKELEFTP